MLWPGLSRAITTKSMQSLPSQRLLSKKRAKMGRLNIYYPRCTKACFSLLNSLNCQVLSHGPLTLNLRSPIDHPSRQKNKNQTSHLTECPKRIANEAIRLSIKFTSGTCKDSSSAAYSDTQSNLPEEIRCTSLQPTVSQDPLNHHLTS